LLYPVCCIDFHHGTNWFLRSVRLCKTLPDQWRLYEVLSSVGTSDVRMGAFDNMLRGESTFMYEMNETAEIMKSATSKSLVVLDEIGRGTATFDGLAIAQAVLRYFVEDTQCLTLFVTHYPQIREIANEKPREVGTFHMGFMERQSQGCRFSSMCFDCRWIS
jgi:hypothetical protein